MGTKLEVVAVEGIEELREHEKMALRYLQEHIAEPGYLIPSLMVQKLISNREMDAVLLLQDMLVLIELKHYSPLRIEIQSLNSSMLMYTDEKVAKKISNPCRNLAYSAKVLSRCFEEAGVERMPIVGMLIFTNDQLGELIVQNQPVTTGHHLMGGTAICRLVGVTGSLKEFRKEWGKKRVRLSEGDLARLQEIVVYQMNPLPQPAHQRIGSYIVDEDVSESEESYLLKVGHQAVTNLPVWIKEYKCDQLSLDPDALAELLLRDAVALSELGAHSALMTYQDYHEVGDRVYIVLRREPGQFLRKWMDAGNLSITEKLHILEDILDGLAHIHSHQDGARTALYRDLRPESVFVTEQKRAKLFNFDCTRLPLRVTAFGQAKAQAARWQAYASFEFLNAQAPEQVSTPTDIYSWGVVAYELFADQPPYPDEKKAARGQFLPLSEYGLPVPGQLQSLIEQALSPQADLRPSLSQLQTATREAASARA